MLLSYQEERALADGPRRTLIVEDATEDCPFGFVWIGPETRDAFFVSPGQPFLLRTRAVSCEICIMANDDHGRSAAEEDKLVLFKATRERLGLKHGDVVHCYRFCTSYYPAGDIPVYGVVLEVLDPREEARQKREREEGFWAFVSSIPKGVECPLSLRCPEMLSAFKKRVWIDDSSSWSRHFVEVLKKKIPGCIGVGWHRRQDRGMLDEISIFMQCTTGANDCNWDLVCQTLLPVYFFRVNDSLEKYPAFDSETMGVSVGVREWKSSMGGSSSRTEFHQLGCSLPIISESRILGYASDIEWTSKMLLVKAAPFRFVFVSCLEEDADEEKVGGGSGCDVTQFEEVEFWSISSSSGSGCSSRNVHTTEIVGSQKVLVCRDGRWKARILDIFDEETVVSRRKEEAKAQQCVVT